MQHGEVRALPGPGRRGRPAAGGRCAAAAPAASSRCRPRRPRPRGRSGAPRRRWTTKPSSTIAPSRWYAVLRGRSQARMIRSSGTGSGWLARNRSTRSARVAAGTWLMAAYCHRPRGGRGAGGRTRIGPGVRPRWLLGAVGPVRARVHGRVGGAVRVGRARPGGVGAGGAGGAWSRSSCPWCRCRRARRARVPVVPVVPGSATGVPVEGVVGE